MAGKRIKGITIEIDGDTTGLQKAISDVESRMRSTSGQLRDVNRLLKLDPKNTELIAQKQSLLKKAIGETTEKLATLKKAQEQANASAGNYTKWQEYYKKQGAEIDSTKEKAKELSREMMKLEKSGDAGGDRYKKLQTELTETTEKQKKLRAEADATYEELGRPISTEAMQGLNREIIDNENTLKRYNEELKNVKTAGQQTIEEAGQKIEAAGRKVSSVGNRLSTTVTPAVIGMGTVAVKNASDFETSMAKLYTISGTTGKASEKLRADILKTSSDYSIAASDIAESTYSAISAGRSTGEAVAFVGDAAQLTKAGFTDMSTSIDVLTTIMNSYGESAGDAKSISDKLITTQNLGKTTVQELGESIGKAIPTASLFGVSLDNLASAYVTMTKNGVRTAESTTYISSMLNELGKNGTKASTALKAETGKTLKQMMDGGASLNDVMQAMQDRAKKTGVSIADMFGSAEAGKAASIIAQHGSDFTAAMDGMQNSSGATAKAFETMEDTGAHSFEELKVQSQNLMIQFGTDMLPTVKDVLKSLSDLLKMFGNLPEPVRQMIITGGLLLAVIGPILSVVGNLMTIGGGLISGMSSAVGVIGAVAGGAGALSGALLPMIGIAAAVSLAIVGIVLVVKHWGEITEWAKGAWDKFTGAVSAFGSWATNGIQAGAGAVVDAITGIVDAIGGAISGIWNAAVSWGRDMIDGMVSGIEGGLSALGGAASKAAGTVAKFLHFSRPDDGPLKDYETWMPDMVMGLTSTLNASRPMLATAAYGMAGTLSAPMQNINVNASVDSGAIAGAVAGAMPHQGDVVIPVYIGNRQIDEIIVSASARNNLRSGGH